MNGFFSFVQETSPGVSKPKDLWLEPSTREIFYWDEVNQVWQLFGVCSEGTTTTTTSSTSTTTTTTSTETTTTSSTTTTTTTSSTTTTSTTTTSTTTSANFALSFDGSVSNYAEADYSAAFFPAGDFTFEFWYKNSASNQEYFISSAWDGLSGWFFQTVDGGRFAYGDGTTDVSAMFPAGSINDNNWHHIAVVRNGTSMKAFVDGVGGTPVTATNSMVDPSTSIQIDSTYIDPTGGGTIDEFRMSNSARYTVNFTPDPSFTPDGNTIAYWRFNEGSGASVTDQSGNGHTLTINGTVPWVSGHPGS